MCDAGHAPVVRAAYGEVANASHGVCEGLSVHHCGVLGQCPAEPFSLTMDSCHELLFDHYIVTGDGLLSLI